MKQTLPDGTEWDTRRAPHMEKYTVIQPCVVQDVPGAHTLSLKIGNQVFRLSNGVAEFFDTKEDAEWSRDMLCIALDRLQRGEDL